MPKVQSESIKILQHLPLPVLWKEILTIPKDKKLEIERSVPLVQISHIYVWRDSVLRPLTHSDIPAHLTSDPTPRTLSLLYTTKTCCVTPVVSFGVH